MNYAEALEFLFPRTTTIKFGLGTTRALLAELGDPHLVMPAIHIGGTNGKGSVAALVAAALGEAGLRVGLYTSPHLVSFRERMLVAGVPVSEAAIAMWTTRLEPLVLAREATFFEATTVMAFADFAARGAEVAVIEVGLGGRLDSTNVVRPMVSAVTRIARDHTKYLGDSLGEIAREKAGIAKPGAPFVVGETEPALVEALRAGADVAVAELAPGSRADVRVVPPAARWEGALGLAGPHQRRNAAVAAAVLEALPERCRPRADATARAFAETRVPGRLDRRGIWLFDVAHNPDGVRALTAALRAAPPPRPLHALVSILGDKEWPEMLVELDTVVDRGFLTMAPTAAGRGWDTEWLSRWLAARDRPPAHADWVMEPDFDAAIRRAREGAGTVLVTGSFHTVGDVMSRLGLQPI
jgi:dihydrofolate synthase/folylpolyglutamate synthase